MLPAALSAALPSLFAAKRTVAPEAPQEPPLTGDNAGAADAVTSDGNVDVAQTPVAVVGELGEGAGVKEGAVAEPEASAGEFAAVKEGGKVALLPVEAANPASEDDSKVDAAAAAEESRVAVVTSDEATPAAPVEQATPPVVAAAAPSSLFSYFASVASSAKAKPSPAAATSGDVAGAPPMDSGAAAAPAVAAVQPPPSSVAAAPVSTATPPPSVLEKPGKPKVLKRSSTTLSVAWPPFASSTEEPDLSWLPPQTLIEHFPPLVQLYDAAAAAKDDDDAPQATPESNSGDAKPASSPAIEYQVRYCRSLFKFESWVAATPSTSNLYLTVDKLTPETLYTFQVRARSLPDGKWTLGSESSQPVSTLTADEELRIHNLARVRQFITEGADGLERYPEDEEKPDYVVDKTSRAFEGILSGVSTTGMGGVYMTVVKNAWRLHKTGLISLIFHEDLQKTVMVLLRFLSVVANEIGLSTRDVAVGSYFALWAAKRERLLHPEAEVEEHADGQPGVIVSVAPKELLDECMYFFSFAGFVYRETPAQVQWVLDRFPHKGGGFRLVAQRLRPGKFKPAFFLAAHEEMKIAVFAVCGTADVEDVVTDGLCEVAATQFRIDEDTVTDFAVHAGMNQAADWLVRGDDRHSRAYDLESKDEDEHGQPYGAGVGSAVAKLWYAGYRQVVFVGHSMGAGVATLAALKVANRFKELQVKVYGYGVPACVDERLAEALKGQRAAPGSLIPWLGARVSCKSVVRHDDVVPRLSILTAREFAMELQSTRNRWGPLLNEDIASFTSRLKTVWAPTQRAHARTRGGPTERVPTVKSNPGAKPVAVDLITLEPLKRSLINRLVPPGIIIHTYMHNGCHRASVVDYKFPPLRRIEPFPDCIEDHRFESILDAVRGVRAADEARRMNRQPPNWESLRDHALDEQPWQVRCRVCTYPVSWHHTSSSEAFEVRATFHCYACGNVVCSKCSEGKLALPSFGILEQVRVCDVCILKTGVAEPTGEREMSLPEIAKEW